MSSGSERPVIGIFASTRSSPAGSPALLYASAALTRASNARRAPRSANRSSSPASSANRSRLVWSSTSRARCSLASFCRLATINSVRQRTASSSRPARSARGTRNVDEVALWQRGPLLFEERRKGGLLFRRESAGDEVTHFVQTRGQRVRERRRVPVRPEGRRCLGARGKQPIENRRRLAKPRVDADVPAAALEQAGGPGQPRALVHERPRRLGHAPRAPTGRRRRRRSRLAPGAHRRAPSGAPSPRRPRGPDAREARRSFPSTADRDTSARTSWRSWRPRRRIASIALRGCRGRSASRRGPAGWRPPSRTPAMAAGKFSNCVSSCASSIGQR